MPDPHLVAGHDTSFTPRSHARIAFGTTIDITFPVTNTGAIAGNTDLDQLLRRLGNVTGSELTRAAEERGWQRVRVTGSHYIYRKGRRTLPIPFNVKSLGVKRSVIKALQAEGDEG